MNYIVYAIALIVVALVVIDLVRHNAVWRERWRIIKHVGWRFVFSLAAPYVLAAIPIVTHLVSILANQGTMDFSAAFLSAVIADGYLFAFIMATSGIVDALTLGGEKHWHTPVLVGFIILAAASGFGNYNAQLDVIVTHPTRILVDAPIWLILGACSGVYGVYKVVRLYAEGKADLDARAAKQAAGQKPAAPAPGNVTPAVEQALTEAPKPAQ